MRFFFLSGIILGLVVAVGAARFYPWVDHPRTASRTIVLHNGGRVENFMIRFPVDRIASTGTADMGLRARKFPVGVEFPEAAVQRAIASIHRQRYPDFAYAYGEYLRYSPRAGINRPAGSLGRSQVCNLALRLYDDPLVTDDVLKTWLKRLIARNGWLSMSRKRHIPGQSPHFADFGVAGYFYYYGHFYATMCFEQLPKQERPYYQAHVAYLLLPLQEKDGSWWDYILYDYHQQYGTAMAISSLVRCSQSPSSATE